MINPTNEPVRSIHEILILIKEKFNRESYHERCPGLCSVVLELYYCMIINNNECKLFYEFYENINIKHKIFFTYNNIRTTNKDQFMYKPFDMVSRNKWLDKYIKITKKL